MKRHIHLFETFEREREELLYELKNTITTRVKKILTGIKSTFGEIYMVFVFTSPAA